MKEFIIKIVIIIAVTSITEFILKNRIENEKTVKGSKSYWIIRCFGVYLPCELCLYAIV